MSADWKNSRGLIIARQKVNRFSTVYLSSLYLGHSELVDGSTMW